MIHWGKPGSAWGEARCGVSLALDNFDTTVTQALDLINCEACLKLRGEPIWPSETTAPGDLPPTEPQYVDPITGDDLLRATGDQPVIDLIEVDGEARDPNTLFQPEPVKRQLSEMALLRLGAEMPEGKASSYDFARYIAEQKVNYALYSKESLIEELCRRDMNLLRKGQEAADGRMAGRLLREFVRGILYTADVADLGQAKEMLAKGPAIEPVLKLLGFEPAGLRDLRVNGGTTVGVVTPPKLAGRSPAEAIQDTSDLSQRQFPSQATTEAILGRSTADLGKATKTAADLNDMVGKIFGKTTDDDQPV